ncbi:uncharacterized protein J4E79_001332 [Alternaria viburni]|uniref:uncharacterized protein n=1 Tax=Alternaria viburni TaxID=566460 RepID=UPI0020C42DC0|nr:uncharacterized protein J4E79_001332 [Alternaria viburni]KAI4669289.1 hypothetical protein J4E79_001332 [Alternaria viburni]
MAPTGLTLENVQAWAIRDFRDQFKHLPDAGAFHVQFNIVRGYNHDNSFKSLVIGSTHTKTGKPADILAWLAGSRIQLGYIGKNRKGEPQVRSLASPEKDTSSSKFKFPFNFVPPNQTETEIACFNAVLRYYFLAKGWSKGVIDESDVFNRFVSRFPYACQAIANTVADRSAPVPNSHALCSQRTPYLFEQIADDPFPDRSYTVFSSPSPSPPPIEDPKTPRTLPSPLELRARSGHSQSASPSGDQIVVLDGSNDADEREGSGLRNKLFDLNIRLMIAEGLARDAEIAARTAQEEAQLWRKRYEEAESYRIKYEEIRSHFGLQEQDERRA